MNDRSLSKVKTHGKDALASTRGLASLSAEADALRARLQQMREDLAAVDQGFSASRSALIMQANEQLVLAALKASAMAESAKHELDDIAHTAQHDPLTGTPNRALLLDRMQRAIAQAGRHDTRFAVLVVDIDHFKHINDTWGHTMGDEVLRQVARRLESAVRGTDTVSRHGGDESLVLLDETTQVDDATSIARKMQSLLAEPVAFEAGMLQVSASIGISLDPDHGTDAGELIAKADRAMYAAKAQGDAQLGICREPAPPMLRELQPRGTLTSGVAWKFAAMPTLQQQQITLLATVAHELRHPLAPLRNAAELLDHAHADEARLRKLKDIIVRQVTRMDRLVGDLLQVSRGSTGKFRLEYSDVDMQEIFMSSIEACRPAMTLRRQHLTMDFPTLMPDVRGDAMRLAQVFGNLLDNASRYTPLDGSISMSATVNPQELVVVIADTGIGIANETLPHIFDLFVQEKRSARTAVSMGMGGGLGIGLSVVHELVRAHGGSVTAHSGGHYQGSTFTVTLPRGKAATEVQAARAAS